MYSMDIHNFSKIIKSNGDKDVLSFGTVIDIDKTGRPIVRLDIDITNNSRPYNYILSYEPKKGDDVVIIEKVIIGKINRG